MTDEAAVLEAADRSRLLEPGRPVVVMLSGGRDSVCLLDVAVRLCGPEAVQALHVNYRLRAAAADDERHCAQLCRSRDVALRIERPPARLGGNLQAWARDARYRAAERLASASAATVAVAHTATDQAETVLYRLAASPGRRALLGMRPREGVVVRPLLGVSREQTAGYCRARGLAWREDETNRGDRYARARVRERLLPALRAVHPAAEANLLRTLALLRDEAEALEAMVDAELGDSDRIAVARLAALPPALRRLVARRMAEGAAGRPAPDAARRVDEIIAVGRRRPRAALHLGGGLRALLDRGELRFSAGPTLSRWRGWRARVSDRGAVRGAELPPGAG
jgi:tRNA(Ile)-lysidine synthase